jgi:hypothetical protein
MLDGGPPGVENPPTSEQLSPWNLTTCLRCTPSTDSSKAQETESTLLAPLQNVASSFSELSAAGPHRKSSSFSELSAAGPPRKSTSEQKSTSKRPNLPPSHLGSPSESANLPPSCHNLKWHLRPPPTPRFRVHTTVLLGKEEGIVTSVTADRSHHGSFRYHLLFHGGTILHDVPEIQLRRHDQASSISKPSSS